MNEFKAIRLATVLCTLFLAAGCASKSVEPTLADAMRGHSEEAQRDSEAKKALAQDWERGAELLEEGRKSVARGEQRIRDAEKAIERGTAEIERGNQQIAAGTELKTRSERRFRERFPDLPLEFVGDRE